MKSVKEVREVISRGETHNVEFKSKFEADKVGQALCCLSNDWPQTGSGVLLIGVTDKTKSIVGFHEKEDELQQAIANICRDAISPSIAPIIHIVELEKPIIVIEVAPCHELPCRYKNDCYIRIGTTTRCATFYEELDLYERTKARGNIHTVVDRLPPLDKPFSFVGRHSELGELWQWFRDTREFRCALAGDGGKGKTAIAYEFASRIASASPEPYEVVLWASSKERKFVAGETVPISTPDFRDLPSLLNKFLNDLGFSEHLQLPTREKEDKLLELLTAFPSLVVIDDLDSIDWSADEKIMSFLTFHLPHTKSKILITTRRQLPSIPTVFISGFIESEGFQFIDTRLQMAGVDVDLLNKEQKRLVLKITDSSALYVEDLLRLFLTIGDWEETISQWSSRSGDEARSYALKREFEMLPDKAKIALLAFSILDQPATSAEVKAVANLTWLNLYDALSELQRLFLIPRPGIVEGAPRYLLNSNTKSLVLSIMENSKELTSVRQALQAIRGESYKDTERRKSVGTYINQASANITIKDPNKAEGIIKAGIQKLGEDPDLIGALGWVYKCFSPPRFEDAKGCFKRANELNCKSPEMYKHWYVMEEQAGSLEGAIDAAESALKVFQKNALWSFRLGHSLSKHGEALLKQFQPRAKIYLVRAQKILVNLKNRLVANIPLDKELHMKILRSLTLNSVALYKSAPDREKRRYLYQFTSAINEWHGLYGNNPEVDYEVNNLVYRYPELKDCQS